MDGSKDKRKVTDTSFEDQEKAEQVFQKSKKTSRSPEGKEGESGMMEAIVTALHDLRKEMKAEFGKSNKKSEELMKELESARKEIKQLQAEMTLKEQKWESDKKSLTDRIEKMEQALEKKERRERENNIVIKNANITGSGKDLITEVTRFIERKIHEETEITRAFKIKENIVIATLKEREQKIAVMKGKKKLKGTNIYIENDMTRTERNIQWNISQIAKGERDKGRRVKTGYQKLIINNKIWEWKEIQKTWPTKN